MHSSLSPYIFNLLYDVCVKHFSNVYIFNPFSKVTLHQQGGDWWVDDLWVELLYPMNVELGLETNFMFSFSFPFVYNLHKKNILF